MHKMKLLALAAQMGVLTGCGGGGDDAPAPSIPPAFTFGSAKSCTDLPTSLHATGVAIASADVREATQATSTTPALPQHCEVTGAIDQRTGIDGQPYAIKFRLRVPIGDAWSGRFVFSGGGGSNGVVGNAMTVAGAPVTPLPRGDAVLSQDSGHDNSINNVPARGGDRAFGFDPQARIDNFYHAHGRSTEVAKEILKTFSGNAPRYAYFA